MHVGQYSSLYLFPAQKFPESSMVSYRYKMTGLKEVRRKAPYSHAFAVLSEAHSLAQMVDVEERAHAWPAQHRSFDSKTSFILERHKAT